MNASLLKFAFLGLLAIGLNAAEPKEEVKAAAAKLASSGYTWTTTTTVPEGGQGRGFRPGPTTGKVDKDGLMHVTSTRGENTTEVVGKGEKFAIKTDGGWKTPDELEADAGDGRGRFRGAAARNTRAPAADVERLLAAVKSLTKEGDAYTGELTEQGAKDLASFGGRRGGGGGGQGPEISGAKGNAKFWVKDGALSKYEYSVKGSMNFNNNDIAIDRTTTVEIKDIGKTTLSVPDDAKKKVS